MTTPTLWIEITLAGAIYVAAICLAFLAGYRVADFPNLADVKDALPYAAVVFVGASYLVGIVFHRIIQVLGSNVVLLVSRLFPRFGDEGPEPVYFEELALIWQLGSTRLQREMDFQFGLLALLRSLFVSIPLLLLSVYWWGARTERSFDWAPIAFGLFFWLCCGVALRRQAKQYKAIRTAAVLSLRKIPTTSPIQDAPHSSAHSVPSHLTASSSVDPQFGPVSVATKGHNDSGGCVPKPTESPGPPPSPVLPPSATTPSTAAATPAAPPLPSAPAQGSTLV